MAPAHKQHRGNPAGKKQHGNQDPGHEQDKQGLGSSDGGEVPGKQLPPGGFSVSEPQHNVQEEPGSQQTG